MIDGAMVDERARKCSVRPSTILKPIDDRRSPFLRNRAEVPEGPGSGTPSPADRQIFGTQPEFARCLNAYVHPEVLVSADWVEEHLGDPKVRVVESDEDVLLYDMGHIPGSVKIDWQGDLQDQLIRDYIDADKFAAICSRAGITPETTVVFYGDKSNWWACYALWAFKLFGHQDCRILNGGRKLWFDQKRAVHDRGSRPTPRPPYTVGRSR